MRDSSKKERIHLENLNKVIQVYIYGYSRKRVLVVHGWSGRGTQLYNLCDKILENQMMVVSFDAPAHGLSGGKRTNMLEFIESIKQIDKKYGPFHAAVGHSFGAMSLINSITRGLKTERLVTIGADNSIPEIFDQFVAKLELKPEISIRLKVLFEKRHNLIIENLNSDNRAAHVSIPVLVIHDSEDKYVDVSSALSIRQNLKNGELLITHGLGHHRIFKDPEVIERIIEFLKREVPEE